MGLSEQAFTVVPQLLHKIGHKTTFEANLPLSIDNGRHYAPRVGGSGFRAAVGGGLSCLRAGPPVCGPGAGGAALVGPYAMFRGHFAKVSAKGLKFDDFSHSIPGCAGFPDRTSNMVCAVKIAAAFPARSAMLGSGYFPGTDPEGPRTRGLMPGLR